MLMLKQLLQLAVMLGALGQPTVALQLTQGMSMME